MFVNVSCIVDSLIFNVFLRIFNDGIWIEPLAPIVKTMIRGIFQHVFQILCNSGVY